ncbi:MAG: helix-turn-helix domain-containing protein [Clostridia bacterium]|nr:helix-turn-helix domain-containing protein [Clostridia bacterium]
MEKGRNGKPIAVMTTETGRSYADIIRSARQARKMSQDELAAAAGVSRNAVAGWETGHSRPDLNSVRPLCRALNISLDKFFGGTEGKASGARRVLDKYLRLDEDDRETVECLMDALIEKRQRRRGTVLRSIVTLYESDLGAAAGFGGSLSEAQGEKVHLLRDSITEQADLIITVSGHSMEPTFHDGDRVLVKRTEEIRPGEIGIFLVNDEGYIKEYTTEGLKSHNPAYPMMRFGDDTQVQCYGRVVGTLNDEQIPTGEQVRQYEEARKDGRSE